MSELELRCIRCGHGESVHRWDRIAQADVCTVVTERKPDPWQCSCPGFLAYREASSATGREAGR